ncbi:amino acid permease [Lentzea tibetensis]|uniref:Amino acid permease n=2 Tax=Lentzea tibetensis TaxID=2591470 RepID=A0A563EFL3_9PSEU|nr:amino acid permease [Lentzea tibetensis]
MIGAGVFAVFGPAAAVAGSGLLLALVIAGFVAYCNAMSSAWLAARYPESGGTYVYGRERLGPFWGYLAGWGFVVGKTASCAAMAMTFGAYAGQPRLFAVLAVVALTAVNVVGVQKSVLLTKVIVTITLLALGTVAVTADGNADFGAFKAGGVLQAAGLLFFAFAGYARIATLGEEVRDPERTIPRAIPLALGITLAVYAVVAFTALNAVGADVLASAPAPLAAVAPDLALLIRVSGCLAALGALLGLILGVSRTVLAMARDRHLPPVLATVHNGVPRHAEVVVGLVVIVLVLVADLRGAIGFSSFCVLGYYAITNVSAWSLGRRVVPALGLLGCAVLAFSLPIASVAAGVLVLALGAAGWLTRKVLWSRSP